MFSHKARKADATQGVTLYNQNTDLKAAHSGVNMLTYKDISVLFLHCFCFIIGVIGNMFILTVNFSDWLKSNSGLNSCGLILSSLGFSNIFHLCVYFVYNICSIVGGNAYSLGNVYVPALTTMFCLRSSSLSFTTVFCVYCCVKIMHFNTPLFLRLKERFPGAVPWLLLGLFSLFLATSLPLVLYELINDSGHEFFNNVTTTASSKSSGGYTCEDFFNISASTASTISGEGCINDPFFNITTTTGSNVSSENTISDASFNISTSTASNVSSEGSTSDAFLSFSTHTASNVPDEGHIFTRLNELRFYGLFLINSCVAALCMVTLTFASATILTFLCSHMRRMGQNIDGFSSSHVAVHLTAMKTITSLFILYALVFLCQCLVQLYVVLPGTPEFSICSLIISIFPAVNSGILILGSSRLKKAFTEIMSRLKCCQRLRGH